MNRMTAFKQLRWRAEDEYDNDISHPRSNHLLMKEEETLMHRVRED